MKYIRTYEKYLTEFNEYVELDLRKFNTEELENFPKLEDLILGKIIMFRGRTDNGDISDNKGVLTNMYSYGTGDDLYYEFKLKNGHFAKVIDYMPIKIYTLESDVKKYNL